MHLAFKRTVYRCLNALYRAEVPHSSKGTPAVRFGTWLYRFGLVLLAVAPTYRVDEVPTEEEIQYVVFILRSYALLVEKPTV